MPNDKPSVDLDRPSAGRIYDYLLGGSHNYAIDREFAEQQIMLSPEIKIFARENRAFLGRAVRFAVSAGIRQFVDIGSGLPTQGNVHEVADDEAPGEARVVYIDNEPVAHAHAQILLEDTADPRRHRALSGDFFDGPHLWEQVLRQDVINTSEPVCLLVVALLHFMPPDQRPEQVMAFYRDQLPSGSLLVLSHGSVNPADQEGPAKAQRITDNYAKKATHRTHVRSRGELNEFFGDFKLIEPGLVWAPEWRPDAPYPGDPADARVLAGVARKP